jgi:hypothetical protein
MNVSITCAANMSALNEIACFPARAHRMADRSFTAKATQQRRTFYVVLGNAVRRSNTFSIYVRFNSITVLNASRTTVPNSIGWH